MQQFTKGRGSQINTPNAFEQHHRTPELYESEWEDGTINKTTFIRTTAKTVVNPVKSPDVGMEYSVNPYQGCEHGCVYCYARNTHTYWGYSAGLDFESVILVKENAPEILEKKLRSKNWEGSPIMFSGNTDCYQPIEKKLELTRKMIELCLRYKNPVGIITKNSLVLRDLDLLLQLKELNLLKMSISLNTLDDQLRQKLEPRASSVAKRIQLIERLVREQIPTVVMVAPIIPGLNSHELMPMVKELSKLGVNGIKYILVRLNGDVKPIFEDWIQKVYPDRADKVLRQIAEMHGGKHSDSRFGIRMRGEGPMAEALRKQFEIAMKSYFHNPPMPAFDQTLFAKHRDPQLPLFT